MDELKLVYLPVDSLTPYDNNARKHTEHDIEAIKESIKQSGGFNDPIGIWGDNNLIVEGHGRLIAAKELGISEVPCIRLDYLTDEERRKYTLLHNQTNSLSDWDFKKLQEELAQLNFDDFDFEFPEFDGRKIEETAQYEEDDYSETDSDTDMDNDSNGSSIKHGDIFKLGNHYLMCGDSTNDSDVSKLMSGLEGKAKILFTSPPYSDMREYEGGKNLEESHIAEFIRAYRPYTDYQCVNLGIKRKEHDIVEYWDEYIKIARNCGYKLLSWNVWDKGTSGSIGMATALFPIRHEFVFVFGTEFYEINCTMEKKPENIGHYHKKTMRQKDGTTRDATWGDTTKSLKQMESVLFMFPEMNNEVRKLHPATFPVGLPAEYIKAMTIKSDTVIEPFGGSGTTLIACEQLERNCRIMEYEPKYVSAIIGRWESLTGMKAEKIS